MKVILELCCWKLCSNLCSKCSNLCSNYVLTYVLNYAVGNLCSNFLIMLLETMFCWESSSDNIRNRVII